MKLTRREIFVSAGAVALGCATQRTPLCLSDFEIIAKERMPRAAYEYIASGAADEITLRWNREAYDRIKLRPRMLVELSRMDTSLTLFGQALPHPIMLAPTAYHRMFHSQGEIATARGAAAAEATYVVSSSSTTSIEDISRAASPPLWFQLYMQDDRGFVRELVQRVEAAGCRAICITVDSPVLGARNREMRAEFRVPAGMDIPMNPTSNTARRGAHVLGLTKFAVTWKDIEWIRSYAKTPVLLKGILNPQDADQAARSGAAGIIVSNHGARNLDTAPATIDALPAIVDQVAGRVAVLVDGGIRRGTDVVKAIAHGAKAVLIGRPYLYGLSVDGADGVERVVRILRDELEMAMALTGRPTLSSIDRSVLG